MTYTDTLANWKTRTCLAAHSQIFHEFQLEILRAHRVVHEKDGGLSRRIITMIQSHDFLPYHERWMVAAIIVKPRTIWKVDCCGRLSHENTRVADPSLVDLEGLTICDDRPDRIHSFIVREIISENESAGSRSDKKLQRGLSRGLRTRNGLTGLIQRTTQQNVFVLPGSPVYSLLAQASCNLYPHVES